LARSTIPLLRKWPLFEASASVEGEREVPAVLDPEVAAEAPFEIGRVPLEPIREGLVLPDKPRQAGAAHLGVVCVPLQLAGGAREAG
jgi:hypothetical protein